MSEQTIDPATGRYLPILFPEEAPFWSAAQRHELVLQSCRQCARPWYPIGPCCRRCLSEDFEWLRMSGRGAVSSFVIYHKGWTKWLQARVPYVVAQVELEEGPRLTTNILDVPPSGVSVGMPVEVAFEDVNERITLVQFRPARPQ